MQRTRKSEFIRLRRLAPWVVAGAMMAATGAAGLAQDATPPAETTGLEIVAEDSGETATADDQAAQADDASAATGADDGDGENRRNREGRGGGQEVAAIPATGAGLAGGLDLFTVGATVSAAAAGVAAFRARKSGH